jgi:hypothetical protein
MLVTGYWKYEVREKRERREHLSLAPAEYSRDSRNSTGQAEAQSDGMSAL